MHLVHSLFTGSRSTVHLDEGSTTAQQIAADGTHLAGALAAVGMAPGDRIAVWARNGLPYLHCLAAAAVGRFVVVSVNTRFSADEAQDLTRRSGAGVLVTDQPIDERLGPDVVVIHTSDINSMVLAGRPVPIDDAHPDDPYVVFTTSGTTSRPKMVLHHQRSITHHAHDVARLFSYDRDARILVAMPLCGVFGLSSLMGALAGDAEIWLPDHFDARAAATTIASAAITGVNGSDDLFHRLLAVGADLSSIAMGGYARFNASLDGIVGRADEAGVVLSGLYGMSEVQALFALRDPSEPVRGRERAGGTTASVEAHVRIVDPDTGEPVPPGVDGELQLSGPSLFAGYLAEGGEGIDGALTDANHVVDEAGHRWFRTGDLARVEADATFTYLSRMGDVLRLGGFLVSPSEIEQVLLEFVGIADAQVVSVARPGGVRPVAIVISDRAIDEEAVIAHCRERLAIYKCPVAVIEVDAFPTTPSANGTKIQRVKLRELAERALA